MSQQVATSQYMDPAEAEDRYAFRDGDFWLGRMPMTEQPLGHSDDGHICLVCNTRCGKGTTSIINNLCLWKGSVVVVDPKGENATVTASRRGKGSKYCEGMGQKVHVLDPFGVATVEDEYRRCFNPLDMLDPGSLSLIDDAAALAEALFVVPAEHKDPQWLTLARSLLQAVILHVVTAPQFDDRRDLVTVREAILHGDRVAYQRVQDDDPKLAAKINARALFYEGMRHNQACNGVVAGRAEWALNLLAGSPKQFEGYHAGLEENTQFIDSPMMQECLRSSDLRLRDLKDDPHGVSVYICLPHRRMATHFRWIRMLVAQTLMTMEEVQEEPACGVQTLVVLDEFAKLERCESVEKSIDYIAGFDVKLFIVLQSLTQLKTHYGDAWETIYGMCSTKIFAALPNLFTLEHVSKLMGDTQIKVEVDTHSDTDGTNESSTRGRSKTLTTGEGKSTSDGVSRSRALGRSQSATQGTSNSLTRGSSSTETHGTSESRARGLSKTSGWAKSLTMGESWGSSRTIGSSSTTSHNESWNADPLLLRNTQKWLPALRDNDNMSDGHSESTNLSTTKTTGGNRSLTQNTSGSDTVSETRTDSLNRSVAEGVSESITQGTSASNTHGTSDTVTDGTSHTDTVNRSRSEAIGESVSDTRGKSKSTTDSTAETVHKRPLITTEELDHFFRWPDDGGHAYALVKVGGERPVVVRRARYFEDEFFCWLYDPHPKHDLPLELIGPLALVMPEIKPEIAVASSIKWMITEEVSIGRGEPIIEVTVSGPSQMIETTFLPNEIPELAEGDIKSKRITLALPSPSGGLLKRRDAADGDSLCGSRTLGELEINRRAHWIHAKEALDWPIGRYEAYIRNLRNLEGEGRQRLRETLEHIAAAIECIVAARREAQERRRQKEKDAKEEIEREVTKARAFEEMVASKSEELAKIEYTRIPDQVWDESFCGLMCGAIVTTGVIGVGVFTTGVSDVLLWILGVGLSIGGGLFGYHVVSDALMSWWYSWRYKRWDRLEADEITSRARVAREHLRGHENEGAIESFKDRHESPAQEIAIPTTLVLGGCAIGGMVILARWDDALPVWIGAPLFVIFAAIPGAVFPSLFLAVRSYKMAKERKAHSDDITDEEMDQRNRRREKMQGQDQPFDALFGFVAMLVFLAGCIVAIWVSITREDVELQHGLLIAGAGLVAALCLVGIGFVMKTAYWYVREAESLWD